MKLGGGERFLLKWLRKCGILLERRAFSGSSLSTPSVAENPNLQAALSDLFPLEQGHVKLPYNDPPSPKSSVVDGTFSLGKFS